MLVSAAIYTLMRGMPCCRNPLRLAQDTVQSVQPADRIEIYVAILNTQISAFLLSIYTSDAGQAQVDLHPDARGMPKRVIH
jgi:hypothetical protein